MAGRDVKFAESVIIAPCRYVRSPPLSSQAREKPNPEEKSVMLFIVDDGSSKPCWCIALGVYLNGMGGKKCRVLCMKVDARERCYICGGGCREQAADQKANKEYVHVVERRTPRPDGLKKKKKKKKISP